MNINLISKSEDIIKAVASGKKILEISEKKEEEELLDVLNIYDPASNTVKEIAPEIKKYNFIPVFNCVWNSDKVFFGTYEQTEDRKLQISIYGYNTEDDTTTIVCSFVDRRLLLKDKRKIKVFVLSKTYILVQTEQKKNWEISNLMGNIEFSLALFNMETGTEKPIVDLNLINNGINCIVPVSPTHVMFKTGYSFMEDERFSKPVESEALIESVYYCVLSQFIATITVENAASGFEMLGTAYFDKCILKPKVQDNYIYFTIFDNVNNSSETVFYNFSNGQTIRALNEDVDTSNLNFAYVLNNMPYIRRENNNDVTFVNLLNSEVEFEFYDESFVTVLGNLAIFDRKKGSKDYMRIYRLSKFELVREERGKYITGCQNGDDYYIYKS